MANFVCVDCETSGLDPAQGAELLEVAVVQHGLARVSKSWFIENTSPIPPQAKAVHHITENMVAPGAAGVITRNSLASELHGLAGDSGIWVAHNSQFDCRFLPELNQPWLCTYRASLHVFPDAPAHSLQVLRYWLDLKVDLDSAGNLSSHRALYDCLCCDALLTHLLKTHTAEELLELSGKPAILHRCRFGKYRGQLWSEVPRDYLQWLIRQHSQGNSFDDDVIATARYWLNGGRERAA